MRTLGLTLLLMTGFVAGGCALVLAFDDGSLGAMSLAVMVVVLFALCLLVALDLLKH